MSKLIDAYDMARLLKKLEKSGQLTALGFVQGLVELEKYLDPDEGWRFSELDE